MQATRYTTLKKKNSLGAHPFIRSCIPQLMPDAASINALSLDDFRNRLQPLLDNFVAGKTVRYARYSDDPVLRAIWQYSHSLVAARGKRLRPYVAYLMFHALREQQDGSDLADSSEHSETGVLRVLLALELFHLFCLVHDDIIDQGEQRHALPTAQYFVMEKLASENRLRHDAHIGNAQAMLLGDMFFAWSQEAFYTHGDFDSRILRQARRYFTLMIDEVVLGEMMDVDMTTRRSTSIDAIRQKMLLKTASYTFIRPLQIGAALAGQSVLMESFCYDLGLSLGIAFQVQDDLLDLVGTEKSTQKTVLSDLREHQHTFFTQYIFDRGTPAQQAALRDLMGSPLSADDRPRVLELFESSGALAHGAAVIRRHLDDACELLRQAPPILGERHVFYELIEAIETRSL